MYCAKCYQVVPDRGPSIPVYQLYTPDHGRYWKLTGVAGNENAAHALARDKGLHDYRTCPVAPFGPL